MPSSGPGSIYPFADQTQFQTTYRAICTHKNISLDLSRLICPVFTTSEKRPLDLYLLHKSVFVLGGEAKVCISAVFAGVMY